MDPRLSAIIDLQEVLSEQRTIEAEYQEVPKRHQEIEAGLNRLKEQIQSSEEAIKQKEIEHNNAEIDLKKGQETRVRKESQLHSIKNEKEYKATISEIENLDRKNTRLEEKVLELMESIDQEKAKREEAQTTLASKEESCQEELRELEELERTIKPRLDDAQARVDEVVQRFQPALYQRFLRVFDGKQGRAIATANNGYCSGCNILLTPRIMQLAKRGQDIVQCEACARFLYWDQSLEEEQLGAL